MYKLSVSVNQALIPSKDRQHISILTETDVSRPKERYFQSLEYFP